MKRLAIFVLLASAPAAVFGESATPSIGYTGAPADHGGQNCITCHTGAAVNDPSGSLQVIASDYSPLGQQLIHIIVQNSHADRWGFQMTIRAQNSPAASAGTFSLAPNHWAGANCLRRRHAIWIVHGALHRLHCAYFAEHLTPRAARKARRMSLMCVDAAGARDRQGGGLCCRRGRQWRRHCRRATTCIRLQRFLRMSASAMTPDSPCSKVS